MLSNDPIMQIEADLEAPQLFGNTPYGERRVINITGGKVSGPRLRGKILPGGADWQIIRADGAADIFAKYTVQIDGGGFVLVTSAGLRHGPPEVIARLAKGEAVPRDQYYFRTCVRFETGDPQADWLNRVLCIAVAAREKMKVKLDLFEVL
ncbi:MAG: DUF3237 domain-containing protein [Xanthobacteraceae bacterium]|nr:DUF3237 domain-containing protein [Xanthobacteraceae bacterium]MCW5678997.1 DUF3237 domain-containing protein [Xanthobacteraceae bacterium]